MGRKKNAKKDVEDEIQKIITRLKTCDETKDIDHEADANMMETLISIGKPAVPSGMIMDVLSGGQYDWKDRFDEEYGEYFDNEEE